MKLMCLSSNPSKPCFVLCFKGVTLMLDCGLDINQLQHYLPLSVIPNPKFEKARSWNGGTEKGMRSTPDLSTELAECAGRVFVDGAPEFCVPQFGLTDLSQVDVILISNYNCMLALPYLVIYGGFKGVVYATEPTLQIGRQYMQELVTYVERTPRPAVSKWKQAHMHGLLPAPLRDATSPTSWKKCYTQHNIDACLAHVQLVGFNEKKSVYGNLTVLPCSSGFCIGSSNWVIQSEYEKICYISGTSTLTTHPKPMDQSMLRNSDLIILTCLTQTPLFNPDTMIGEFCVHAAVTIKNGGNVLVPCYPSGITFDLFECLSGHLETCGLSHIPLYFISAVADSTLAYSNIFAEWLSQSKQSKVYLPEPPFPHAELMALGRLKSFTDINAGLSTGFKTPCIVFAGHPSLRCGDVVHFIEMWGKSASNTIIFTEPDFPYLDALAPYQPLAMKHCYCPIDTSLNFGQANKLIKELKPLHLVCAESYMTAPVLQPHRTDLVIEWDPPPLTYKQAEVLSLPVKRQFERIELTPQLAMSLEPVEVKPGSMITMVTAAMSTTDNKYTLMPVPVEMMTAARRQADGVPVKPKPYVFGSLDVQQFVAALSERGITDVTVEDSPVGQIIHLSEHDTLIRVEPDSTHIICECEEAVRVKIRDTLLKCLSKL